MSNRRILCLLSSLILITSVNAFLQAYHVSLCPADASTNRPQRKRSPMIILYDSSSSGPSRRDVLYWSVGAVGAGVYGKLVSDAIGKISRGRNAYPIEHESRVQRMIEQTLWSAASASSPASASASASAVPPTSLRILEVGIGSECRLLERGLYDKAVENLASSSDSVIQRLEIFGMDISIPNESIQQKATDRFKQLTSRYGIEGSLHFVEKSITTSPPILDWPDGYFDAIVCSLTLCSVDDPDKAIRQIDRLLRSNGGTFGYVEHVAVNSEEPYRLLSVQQQIFDPLQHVVAENCHLHRSTDTSIERIFSGTSDKFISKERFLVDGMWPVSCQASGVIQKGYRKQIDTTV